MAEVSRRVVDFFAVQLGHEVGWGCTRKNSDWQPVSVVDKFFKELAKKGSPLLKKKVGQAFAEIFLEDLKNKYDYPSIQEGISYIPKLYMHYFRGDGAGIWQTEQVSDGYIKIKESSPFDCLFTEGLLSGLLSGMGAMGAMVRHPVCRKDEDVNKYCVYELVWMKRNKV